MAHEAVGWLQEHENFMLPVLEPVSSHFSITHLDDKPQDPIVQTIQSPARLPAQSGTPPHNSAALPSSPAPSRTKVSSDVSTQLSKPVLTSMWNELPYPRDVVSVPFVITHGVIHGT